MLEALFIIWRASLASFVSSLAERKNSQGKSDKSTASEIKSPKIETGRQATWNASGILNPVSFQINETDGIAADAKCKLCLIIQQLLYAADRD